MNRLTASEASVSWPTGWGAFSAPGLTAGKDTTIAKLIQRAGTASRCDMAAVRDDLRTIPAQALLALQVYGYSVVVCGKTITEHRRDLCGKHPRGWTAGKTWDECSALHQKGREIVVAVRGSSYRPGRSVAHEVGHAFDVTQNLASQWDPQFHAARARDQALLGNYYRQAGDVGASETYAEAFSLYTAGDRKWPALWDYWWRVHETFANI